MEKIEIYKKIAELDTGKDSLVLATITDYKDSGGEFENIYGEKILFKDDGSSFSTTELKPYLADITDKLEFDNDFYNRRRPQIKLIELGDRREIELFLEPVQDNPRLIIFGSGHVAQPVAEIAHICGFLVNVIDDREDLLNRHYFPTADKLICEEYVEHLKDLQLRADDYVVIVTRGHQHDYDVLKGVIASQARYIGMIGSNKKVKLSFDRLKEKENISQDLIDRVDAPIGIDLGSETPAEIAVSIMSKIISVRRGRDEA